MTKNAPKKFIGSEYYNYFSYGVEWGFNHLPQPNLAKLKEQNKCLLAALKDITAKVENLSLWDKTDTAYYKAKEAIRKAEQ